MFRNITILLAVVGLTACTSLTPTPEVEPTPLPEPEVVADVAPGDDAYDIIERASEDLFNEESFVGPPLPPGQQPIPLIWERLIAGFTLPTCELGSTAHTWQEWYGNHPDYMQRVFLRARPWLFDIMAEIETRGLPSEFALLPIVESAYDTFAFSSAAAVGGWQFTAPTAKDYGLPINTWYDGRRDMYAATRAALNYLKVLLGEFEQNWRLALAGYNAGPGRVSRALRRHGGSARDLSASDLRLPKETHGFAPKLHGLSCLLRDTEQYSLKLPAIPDIPLITAVEFEQPMDLVYAAHLIDLPVRELYALNPGLNRWSTPPNGPHRLILPIDKAEQFRQGLANTELPTIEQWQIIVVQSGDTLSGIASKHNTTTAILREQNQIRNDQIFPGQELRTGTPSYAQIPGYDQALAELKTLQSGLLPSSRTSHRIRNGESLSTIARQYGVNTRDLQRWNQISDPHRIRAGQQLVVLAPVKPTANRRYRVQPGDSLWRIANRHKLTVESLRNWNRLAANSILQPGQVLVLAPNP